MLRAENLYHTGLVVDDIDAARRWYAQAAAYVWGPTVAGEQVIELAGSERRIRMTVAYSVSEPRLELIQSVPGTIWVPTNAGVHHLGYWSEDVDADLSRLLQQGAEFEAKSIGPNGAALWCYCRHPANGRIELVSTVMKPALERLFTNPG